MRSRRVVLALMLALAAAPAQGSAEPIDITGGSFSVAGVHAAASFEFEGDDFSASGWLEPGVVWPDLTCGPCAAGDTIRFDTEFLASPGSGTATIAGTAFPQVSFAAFDFVFDAPAAVAPGSRSDLTFTAPFTFSGRLLGAATPELQFVFFDQLVRGEGLLTASFQATPNPDGPPLFSFRSIRYDFSQPAPVPEPATLALFATGLGAMVRWRKRLTPKSRA